MAEGTNKIRIINQHEYWNVIHPMQKLEKPTIVCPIIRHKNYRGHFNGVPVFIKK